MSRTRRGAAGGSVGCPVLAAGLSKNGAVGLTQPINTAPLGVYPDPGNIAVKDHLLQIYTFSNKDRGYVGCVVSGMS